MKFEEFPNEIMLYIFSYLNLNDLFATKLVCRKFNDLYSDGVLRSAKRLYNFDKITDEEVKNFYYIMTIVKKFATYNNHKFSRESDDMLKLIKNNPHLSLPTIFARNVSLLFALNAVCQENLNDKNPDKNISFLCTILPKLFLNFTDKKEMLDKITGDFDAVKRPIEAAAILLYSIHHSEKAKFESQKKVNKKILKSLIYMITSLHEKGFLFPIVFSEVTKIQHEHKHFYKEKKKIIEFSLKVCGGKDIEVRNSFGLAIWAACISFQAEKEKYGIGFEVCGKIEEDIASGSELLLHFVDPNLIFDGKTMSMHALEEYLNMDEKEISSVQDKIDWRFKTSEGRSIAEITLYSENPRKEQLKTSLNSLYTASMDRN